MKQVIVVVPSRGRPERLEKMLQTYRGTKSERSTRLVVILNEDDPRLPVYEDLNMPEYVVVSQEFNTLTKKLNEAASWFWEQDVIIGYIADDNSFGTYGWDKTIAQTLENSGIAYGNDMYHGENLPTSVFITSDIVRALGWYANPFCEHLFLDDAWKTLGKILGRLYYLPDVIIEHLHPVVGKGAWDDTYALSNTQEKFAQDKEAFEIWREYKLKEDIELIRKGLAGE